MKTAGREAGRYCVILKKLDSKFVLVTGPKFVTGVKRRKCNINHLEPLMEKINIKEDASDEDVFKAYETHNIFEKLSLEKPKEIPKEKPPEEKPKEVKPKRTEPKKEKVVKEKKEVKQSQKKQEKETKKQKEKK